MSAREQEKPESSAVRARRAGAVLDALRVALPGFEARGHDVVLTSGDASVRVDWTGTDGDGRAVLAALRTDGDDAAILWALDAVAFARATREPHSVDDASPPAATTLVALVVSAASRRLLSGLALLPRGSLVLFELRTSRVEGRPVPRLERIETHSVRVPARSARTPMEDWPAPARALADSIAARMQRIDPALEPSAAGDGVEWSWRGADCARISLVQGVLSGACEDQREPTRIEHPSAADRWLEQVLRAHAERLKSHPGSARPADLLARGRPLLTPEELAAFRD